MTQHQAKPHGEIDAMPTSDLVDYTFAGRNELRRRLAERAKAQDVLIDVLAREQELIDRLAQALCGVVELRGEGAKGQMGKGTKGKSGKGNTQVRQHGRGESSALVMDYLRSQQEPVALGQIAQATGVSTGTVHGILAKTEGVKRAGRGLYVLAE